MSDRMQRWGSKEHKFINGIPCSWEMHIVSLYFQFPHRLSSVIMSVMLKWQWSIQSYIRGLMTTYYYVIFCGPTVSTCAKQSEDKGPREFPCFHSFCPLHEGLTQHLLTLWCYCGSYWNLLFSNGRFNTIMFSCFFVPVWWN